jgi:hypothetical protein
VDVETHTLWKCRLLTQANEHHRGPETVKVATMYSIKIDDVILVVTWIRHTFDCERNHWIDLSNQRRQNAARLMIDYFVSPPRQNQVCDCGTNRDTG